MTENTLVYPPRVTAFTRTFWDGLRDGTFLTTRCQDCGHMTFPPKPVCPECWKSNVEWVELSGRGVLVSYTEVSAAPQMFEHEAPYTLCIVDLDESVRCVSRVLAAWDDLAPDARVRLKIRDSVPTPLFEFVLDTDDELEV
ncbi:Zn-ribbon domain-containing OB-fold protein [Microbacterium pygmaeum]|uniref:Rubredoxin-like zinc ribbon domain n=1 Tax=Microbacterium pygmaeum TaxID=370764 RepID=A0A1G7XB86_9MICO|nr:Zn-ribbon domain-containing OB-fold protein [Microbacterium pygmaeum]SDG81505.1 hypothetical protein SAMN04489810_1368 [Microbacterium pygmaeum]